MEFNEPLAGLGHLELEELDEEFGRGARQKQLRAARHRFDFLEQRPDAVAGAQALARDHRRLRQQRLGVAEIQDGVAALQAFDDPRDHLTHAAAIKIDDQLALGLAHLLHDDLLRGLGRDAPELDGIERILDEVADLDVRIVLARIAEADLTVGELDRLHLIRHHFPAAEGVVDTGVTMDSDARVDIALVTLARGGRKRRLDRQEDRLLIDALLARDRVDNH